MANSLLTIDMITKRALAILHEKLSFLGTVNTQFDDSFGRSDGKIGDTLRIRLPSQYVRRQGSRVMDVQDSEQQNTTVTTATQDGVDMKFNSRELALDMEDFEKLHLEPAVAVLASGIEGDVLADMTRATYQVVGTPGTPPTTLVEPGAARAKLNQSLTPKDNNRCIQMDSVTMGGMVNGVAAYFNPSNAISEQYREGLIARTAMADYYENERVWTMTNTSDVAGVTLDTYTVVEGDVDISITGSSVAQTAGMVFTIADVYDCHDETKAAYSHLKQFVVVSATTAAITFSPAIYTTGARKNVSAADGTDVSIGTTAALVWVGSASTSYTQNLMYHKDAFTFVTADLPMMADAAKCVTQQFEGISLRCWQASDIRNDEMLTRLDILYGSKAIRPEWACRITN